MNSFQLKLLLILCMMLSYHLMNAQCSPPLPPNAILRQPGLYQLIGNVDGALDIPNGTQAVSAGNTLNEGNWLNRGIQNLITNGDFTLPGAPFPLRVTNGTGGNGSGPIQLASIPGWTIGGNSLNAYPYYAFNLGLAGLQQIPDYAASQTTLYLGNQKYATYSSAPVYDNGYATNSSLVQPYIVAAGITAGYGQNPGDPVTLSQSITTQLNKKYRIQFYITGESTEYGNPWLCGLDITGYNRMILQVPNSVTKTRYEFEFTATSVTTTIKFINWGHSLEGTNTTEFVLDDIIVNLVPDQCVVPLKLISFAASNYKNFVQLSWQTTNEQNTSHFEIQHSQDPSALKTIGNISSLGNSTNVHNYSFKQENPQTGYNYYRLKMIDIDGEFIYSKIISIKLDAQNEMAIFPIPVKNLLNIQLHNFKDFLSLILLSYDGKKLKEIKQPQETGQIDMTQYSNGFYIVCLIGKDGHKVFTKFTKTSF